MSGHLLKSRKFAPLFWCQFFSAFNDSYLKTALVFLLMIDLVADKAGSMIQVAGALFMAPSFILSGLGGEWADRYDKALIARRLKLVEFVAVAIASVGFFMNSLPLLFVALTGFGVLSAFFGPIKYGILPDQLVPHDLPAGNALVEGATFIAVIAGTFVAALAMNGGSGDPVWFCLLLLGFAAASWVASLFIPRTGEGDPNLKIDRNVLRSTAHLMRHLWQDTRLWRGGIIVAFFWLIGAVVFGLLPPLVKMTLGGTDMVVSVYLAVFAIGIAVGSGLASWLLDGRTLMLPTPIAGLAIGLLSLDFAWTLHGAMPHQPPMGVADFFRRLAGLACRDRPDAAGDGRRPLHRPILRRRADLGPGRPPRARRRRRQRALGRVHGRRFGRCRRFGGRRTVACDDLRSAGLHGARHRLDLDPDRDPADQPPARFRGAGVPPRLSARGHGPREHREGRAERHHRAQPHEPARRGNRLLDPRQRSGLRDRPCTFAQKWWMKPVVKYMNALPLDPTRPLATRQLIQAVKGGATLVIFPEGRITRTGSLMKVYDGSGLIADKSRVPVVPVRIEGAEKTRFSYLSNRQVNRSLVQTDQGDHIGAAAASTSAGRSEGPRAAPGGGRRALFDHVGHDLQDDLDRPHGVPGRGRRGDRAWPEPYRSGGSRSPAR